MALQVRFLRGCTKHRPDPLESPLCGASHNTSYNTSGSLTPSIALSGFGVWPSTEG